jgi:uncharacterized protein YndB with AHSA1/START domain
VHVEIVSIVRHPVERVFETMSDPVNRPLWQEKSQSVQLLTDGEPGLGTRWRERVAGIGVVDAEVVAFEPNVLWEEHGVAKGGEARVRVAFEPEEEVHTRLNIAVEMHLKGARRMMEPMLGPMVRSQMGRDLQALEVLLTEE